MDDPDLDPAAHHDALRGLARINLLSLSANVLWPPLQRLARRVAPRPLRVLDIATGAGDVPIRLWKKARRAGLGIEIEASDCSAIALDHARDRAARDGAEIGFRVLDALEDPVPDGFDAIISSLFLHQLSDAEAIAFLTRTARAAPVVLINDLRRHIAGWCLAVLATRVITRSRVVHYDGKCSVEAAFTMPEVLELTRQAGLSHVRLRARWPWRFLLTVSS